ncbi:MAG: MFS transporter, partial [Bauldia sp.]|nr:MFS transporter [Bauldia sp.]
MSTLRPIFSLLLGLFFLIVGHGMQIALIPLRAKAEGWSDVEIGAIGSAYYIGFVIGCVGAPYLIRRAGHIRAFAALVALVSSAMVAHPLWVAFPVWFGLRMLLGASLAGLYMVMESWINDRAANTNRGLTMSAYIMVNYGALAIGQLMVTLYSPLEFSLFAIATISMSLAAIPLALTRQAQPAPVAMVRFRPLSLYRTSPVGFVGVTASGVANGSFWSLGAVAAVGIGMSSRDAAFFMGIVTAAGALAQWPAGRLSDKIDRRLVLVTLLVAAAFVGLLFAFLPIAGKGWLVLAALFGMAIAPTYSVAAAHAYDYATKGTTVET